ncbi:hypothetical protein OROGR_000215 [Orobanche gracilis]
MVASRLSCLAEELWRPVLNPTNLWPREVREQRLGADLREIYGAEKRGTPDEGDTMGEGPAHRRWRRSDEAHEMAHSTDGTTSEKSVEQVNVGDMDEGGVKPTPLGDV